MSNFAYRSQSKMPIRKETKNLIIRIIPMMKCKYNKSKNNHNRNKIHHKNNQIR